MADLDPRPAAAPIRLAEEPDFELGEVTVSPAERVVVWDGKRRELQPRVMRVLVALAKARPKVVSRDRLVETCWDGRVVGDDALNRCILSLRHLVEESNPPPFVIETVPRVGYRLKEAPGEVSAASPRPFRRQAKLAAAIATAGAVAALLVLAGFMLWGGEARVPSVLITASSRDPGSEELARDLTVKLSSLHQVQAAPIRLIGERKRSSGEADLILEVMRSGDSPAVGANLVLKGAPDRSILWSEELTQPSGHLADLKQQVVFLAARVLGCASEALDEDGQRLRQQTLKLYLSGCAAVAELYGREAESVILTLREVVRDSPRFEAAWTKLLMASSEVALHTGTPAAKSRLRAYVGAARKLHPNLPEAYIAEIDLLPGNAYAERMRLANRAVEISPDNARAYAVRAQNLQFVGRMKAAVVDARRAMQLDPLSPGARTAYIFALAAAGLYDRAFQELREAERLWPAATIVAEVRFALNLRMGNPREAWNYLSSDPSADWMNAQSYLEARIDRTPAKIDRAIDDAERLYRADRRTLQHLVQVYGEFDRGEQLLQLFLTAPEPDIHYIDLTFRAPGVDFWENPKSLLVAKRAGLLDYWRTSGEWPDFCSSADLPYDCEVEAAKIAS